MPWKSPFLPILSISAFGMVRSGDSSSFKQSGLPRQAWLMWSWVWSAFWCLSGSDSFSWHAQHWGQQHQHPRMQQEEAVGGSADPTDPGTSHPPPEGLCKLLSPCEGSFCPPSFPFASWTVWLPGGHHPEGGRCRPSPVSPYTRLAAGAVMLEGQYPSVLSVSLFTWNFWALAVYINIQWFINWVFFLFSFACY